jgi:hypothetical protein
MCRKNRVNTQIILFLALIAASAAALRPVQERLLSKAEVLRDECVGALETLIGKTVTYGSMGPSVFGAIDIRDIAVHGEGILRRVTVRRLRAGYSLAAILFPAAGGSRLDALTSVGIKGLVVEAAAEKGMDELFAGDGGNLFTAIKDAAGMIPRNLAVRLSDGAVRFTAEKSEARLDGLALSARMTGDFLRFRISLRADARLETPALPAAMSAKIVSAKIDGVYDTRDGVGDIKAALAGAETSYFTLNKLALLARLTEDGVRLQKAGDTEAYDFRANYGFADSSVEARAAFAAFRPSRILRFSPELAAWNAWLGTRLSGSAQVSFGKAGLAYGADLQGMLDGASPLGSGNFRLDADGNAESVVFNVLELSMPRGEAVWRGSLGFKPLTPTGELTLNGFSLAKTGRTGALNGSFLVSSYGSAINLFAETFSIGGPGGSSPDGAPPDNVELQAVDITIDRANADIVFSMTAFRVRNAESYDEASFSPVTVDGSFDSQGKNMEASLGIESISLYDMLKIAGIAAELPNFPAAARNFFDNILITSEVFVFTDFKDFLYNVPHLIVAWEGSENIWASLSLSGNNGGAELNEGRIVWNDAGLGITASALFEDINDILFNAELRMRDSAYTFQANLFEKSALHVSSSLGLNLTANFFQGGAFSGFLSADAPSFPVKDGFAEVAAEAGFRYDSPASWNFNLEKFKISGLKSPVSAEMTATVEAMGSIDQDGADLPRIYFDDGRGALYGNATGSWEGLFTDGRPAVSVPPDGVAGEQESRLVGTTVSGVLELRSIDGGERLNADARYSDGTLLVWARVAELQSGRFFGGADNMFITGDAGFFKTRENWSVALNLSSLRGVFRGQNVTLSGTGSFDNTRLDISGTSVSFGNYFASIPSLSIDLRASSLNSSARVWGNVFGGDFNTEVRVTAGFAETDSWFNIKTALESFNLDVNFENTKISAFESEESFEFKVSRKGDVWNVEGGLEDMMRLHMNSGGDFFAAFSYPLPVIGTIAGFIRDGMIDAESSALYIDVARLLPYIPTKMITIAGGFAVAEIRIEGPLRDPGFFGTASVNSLRVGVPSLLADEIGPTPAFLTFAGNAIRVEPMTVRIGDGEGVLSGSFQISRWRPASFDVSLAVAQASPIKLNTVIAGFLVDGSVFGRLDLGGDGRILRISGDVSSDNTEISLAANEDERSDSGGQLTIQTDLNITAGKKVEFLWPNTNIPVLQAYAAAGSGIRVVNDTLSGHFSITGDINIRSGEVFYFQRSFYIKEGQINFNESEIQLDPRFSVVAETREQTNREQVTISMIVENQPLSSFTPRLESNPALSQTEIFTLLGNNLSGTPDENNAIQRAFVSSTADMLAQFWVVRRVERIVRDFLHIDMFSLRTQALQNAILLNVFSNTDSAEDDEFVRAQTQNDTRIGNYFDNTTVFFGKYIGAGLFVQAMLSMRYDPLRENMGGLWVEPDLSMEFKGPLFDIRWDLTPAHPENIWINDNRITLSKKWTLP